MKTLYKLFLIMVLATNLVSCDSDQNIEANPSFTISFLRTGQTNAYVGSEFYVIRSGESEFISVYDGSEGHVYGEAGATGVFFDKNDSVPLIYKKPGNYTITVVASSSTNLGKSVKRNINTYDIVAVDNRNSIANFYIADNTGGMLYMGEIIQDSIFINIPDIVTDLNFKPSFVLNSDLSKVFVEGVEQTSGLTVNNFSTTINYKVLSSIQTEKNYYVKVKKYTASDKKLITKFMLAKYDADAAYRNSNGEIAIVNPENATINLSVNYGTVKTSSRLIAESSYGSKILINGVAINVTKRYNLNTISDIKVIAQNNTEKIYSLIISDQDPIESFTFSGLIPAPVGRIDKLNKTVIVDVLQGTDIQNLTAKWTGSVGKVIVDGVEQVNATSTNDFSTPKTYIFYKGTSPGESYTVSVNIK